MNKRSFLVASHRLGARLLTAMLLLCGLTLASPAIILADTYTYTGSPLGVDPSSPNFDPSFTSVSGFFTVAGALAANQTEVDITAMVTNFSFSDGADTISTANLPLTNEDFIVSTDNSGAIINWEVLLGTSSGQINSCHVQPQVPWGNCWPGTGFGGTGDEVFFGGYVGLVVPGSGAWAITPEPSSLLLLGVGLLGVGGSVKRKFFS